MRGFRAYFAIVARTIRRNRHYQAKRPMHLVLAATRNSSQIRQVKSALSVTRTFRAERLRRFRRCVASTQGSITRNTRVLRVLPVTDETVAVWGSRFLRGRMLTSRVLAVTRLTHRRTGAISRRAAPVISLGVWFALQSRHGLFELGLVMQITMRLRSWVVQRVIG